MSVYFSKHVVMLKIVFLVLICCLFSFKNVCFTQVVLDYNNTKAYVTANGSVFRQQSTFGGYFVTKDFPRSIVMNLSFAFVAKDANNQIHVSNKFQYSDDVIYQGPVTSNYSDPDYQGKWFNKIWKISQVEIDHFVALFNCNHGVISAGCDTISALSNEVLNTIYTWPGNGDVSKGQQAQLAPYNDINGNGIYEPQLGEHPIIKGMSAVYIIQNEEADHYLENNSIETMGLEFHTMIYQFKAYNKLNNSTFIDLTVFNRSSMNYPQFIVSLFADSDVGDFSDDYAGCDSTKNLMYFYNGDGLDQVYQNVDSLGNLPPAFGIVSLNHNLLSCVFPEFTSNQPFPDTIPHPVVSGREAFWNTLNGLISYGDPYLTPSGRPTKFLFHGNPSVASQWSEVTANRPAGDRSGRISTRPINLPIGAKETYTFGLVYERSGSRFQNVNQLLSDIPLYQQACNTDFQTYYYPTIYANTNEIQFSDLVVYPNPASDVVRIACDAGMCNESFCSIYNLEGQKLLEVELTSSSNTIHVSDLQNGTYLLKIEKKGVIQIQKLVVNK